jgi:hypothetical protein
VHRPLLYLIDALLYGFRAYFAIRELRSLRTSQSMRCMASLLFCSNSCAQSRCPTSVLPLTKA